MAPKKNFAGQEAAAAGTTPTGTPSSTEMTDNTWREWMPLVADVPRQSITAATLNPAAAGTQSEFDRAGFYNAYGQAQAAGRQVAGEQASLAQALRARAEGRGGPSIAEMQLQRTLEANRRAAAGQLATAGRGINPALAQRLLLQQQGSLGQEAAGQAAILRAQEQLAAQGQLAGLLGQMRGAEQAQFSAAGQLGLSQEKLGVESQEAQTNRLLELALANQQGEQERQRLQQIQENNAYQQVNQSREAAPGIIGKVIGAIAKSVAGAGGAGAYNGGMVQNYAEGGKVSKAKVIAAHAAAKKNMKSFAEQYGKDEGKDIAYATMMKLAKENKLAEGGKAKKSWRDMKWSDSPPWLSKDKVYEDFTPDVLRQLKEQGDEGKFRHWGDLSNYNKMSIDEELKKKNEKKPPIIFPLKKEADEVPEMLKRTPTPEAGILNAAGGGKVHAAMGHLAKMDNKKNDTVPAMLSPGEIVLPRSVVNSPNAPLAASQFVKALLANKDKKTAKMEALKAALTKKK